MENGLDISEEYISQWLKRPKFVTQTFSGIAHIFDGPTTKVHYKCVVDYCLLMNLKEFIKKLIDLQKTALHGYTVEVGLDLFSGFFSRLAFFKSRRRRADISSTKFFYRNQYFMVVRKCLIGNTFLQIMENEYFNGCKL